MARYYIPEKIVPHKTNQLVAIDREMFSTFDNVDFQRTRFWCIAAAVAIDVPRRLGPDASPRELSLDKRISRKMHTVYINIWKILHRDYQFPPAPEWGDRSNIKQDPIANRIGATVIWDQQIHYLMDVVNHRMALLTEFYDLARADNMARWYNKHGELLGLELDYLQRVNDFIEEKVEAGLLRRS